MLENELVDKAYSYAFYITSAVTLLTSVVFQNIYLLALAVFLLALAALYFRSGHILNNFLLKKGKVIEVYNGYRIGENLAAAVKKVGDSYHGISCAILKDGAGERNTEALESIVYNTSFPFEYSIGIRSVDQEKLLDGLEEKRKLKEIEISRCDQRKYERLNTLRRELNVIEDQIRKVRGQKPLSLVMKLKTFSNSNDEFDAAREAYNSIVQLSSSFGSSLGFECDVLKGEQLMNELAVEGGTE